MTTNKATAQIGRNYRDETDSGISSDDAGNGVRILDTDPDLADLESEIADVAEDIRRLSNEMNNNRSDTKAKTETFEDRMAAAAAKLAPLYNKILRMPEEERREFLLIPSTPNGAKKKWPDSRAVDPFAVMLVHKYVFDEKETRQGNINTLCNRIGYTAASLAKVGITEYDQAYRYVMEHGRPRKISLEYTSSCRNKLEIGRSILDGMPSKLPISLPEDDHFPTGEYRAFLVRKAEGAVYHLIADIAKGSSINRIIEAYYGKNQGSTEQSKDNRGISNESTVTSKKTEHRVDR